MTDPPAKRQKKGYQKSKSFQFNGKRRHCLEVGQRGFLATCNNREKNCIRECYNVLKQYADELYGPEKKPENKKKGAPKKDKEKEKEVEEETDIADDLQKEIDAARAVSGNKRRRFQAVDTGTKNCVFIRTSLSDPVELGVKLIKDIAEKKLKKSRFLLRLTPIEVVCKAEIDEISKAGDALFDKYFLGEGKTFSVVYNKRYNNEIKRDIVIKTLADKVLEMNPKNKVDLSNPEVSVIAEIVKGKCCLSVVEGYLKYRKYNLVELATVKAENGGAKKDEDEELLEKEPSEKKPSEKEQSEKTSEKEQLEKTSEKEETKKSDDNNDNPKQETAAEDADATENDSSSPEDIVRDVPVGNKLKELLERKKTSGEEPNAKKFKDESEQNANTENPEKAETAEKPEKE